MRLIFAVFSLMAVAAVSFRGSLPSVHPREVQQFRAGQEYRYQLDTQISSGFATVSDQHSITRIQAQVYFQFQSDRKVVMRMEDIEMGTLNRDVSEPEKVQPMQMFKKMSIDDKLDELLRMPLQFDYVDGIIEALRFHQDDKPWSKNIKRSVLNMIQSNIKQRKQLVPLQPEPEYEQEAGQVSEITMFTLPEMTLEGECQTTYSINKMTPNNKYNRYSEDDKEVRMFNVTKSVDFKRCNKVADLRFGPKIEQPCAKCDVEKLEEKKLDRTTVIRQVFVGSMEKFGIQKAEMVSHYMFKMINAEEERPMHSVVAGELNYVEAKEDRQSRRTDDRNMGQEEEMLYSIEWETNEKRFYMLGDEEFPNSSPFKTVTNKVNQIEKLITRLVNLWSDKIQGIESEGTGVFTKIIELTRMCTVDELMQVFQKVNRNSDRLEGAQRIKAEEIFVDALTNAATYNSIKFLVEKTLSKDIETQRAVRSLTYLKGIPAPSEKQVDMLLHLCKSELSQRSESLRQTCWLTAGAIIGELCDDEISREDGFERNLPKPICQAEQQQKFVKAFMDFHKRGETRYAKILALKGLGNAGLSEATLELEKIIRDIREDPMVRMQAIDSLRRLRAQMPHRIQRILLPIFQNVRERPTIRMAALSMILPTIPDNRMLDQIGYTLLKEPSLQVKSYAYSAMKRYSESPVEIEKQLAKHLKSLLHLAGISEENEEEFLRGSRFIRVPFYSLEDREGLLSELESMVGPDNYLPKQLTASIDSVFSGILKKNKIELRLNQENIEEWYHKIFASMIDQYSYGSRKYSELRANRRSDRSDRSSEEYQDRVDSLYSSLNIKKRTRGQFWNVDSDSNQGIEPYGMLTFRYSDVDYAVLPLEEEILPEYIKEYIVSGKKPTMRDVEDIVKLLQGKPFHTQSAFNLLDSSVKVPTSMGMPIRMVHTIPILGSIDGTIRVKLSRTEVTVESQIHPIVTATHLKRVEIWSPIVMTGAETSQTVELNWPVNSVLKAEFGDRPTAILTVKIPETKTQIFGLHTLPQTYVAEIEKSTQLPRMATVKRVENSRLQQQLRVIDTVYGEEALSLPLRIHGDIHLPHDVTSYKKIINTLLTSENHIHFEFEPTNDSPKEIVLRMDGNAFSQHNDMTSHRELKGFYSKAKFDNEYERYYESENENENDNDRFDSYLNNYEPRKMYKHQVRVELQTKGGRQNKYGRVEMEAACDDRVKFCNAKIQVSRSPFYTENQEWEMQADVHSFYPEYVNEVEELERENKKNQKFVAKVGMKWGPERKQEITLHINGEQFRPKQWVQKISGIQRQDHSYSSLAEQMKLKIAFLNKFDISADYKLQPSAQTWLNQYYGGLKAWEFWSTETKPFNGRDGSIFATVVIDPITHEHVNITVKTPSEKVLIDSLRLPFKTKPFELVRPSESWSSRSNSFMDVVRSYSSKTRPECQVDGRRVQTFDDVTYKAPLTKCYSVLAKDCSSTTPRFAVLMKKLDDQNQKLKVITGKQIVEVYPDNNGNLIVKINGDRVTDAQELRDYGIDYSESEVNIDTRDVSVRFNGQKAWIKLAQTHKNTQCGLCGHYNDDAEDEFRMANNEHTNDLKGFHKSYTLDDDECRPDMEETHRRENYRTMDSDEYNSSEELEQKREKKPIEKTQVVEYNHKVCFSSQPIKECPRRTGAKETEEKKVKYLCFQRDSSEGRQYLRETHRNPKAVLDLPEQNPSYTETIRVPVSCSAY